MGANVGALSIRQGPDSSSICSGGTLLLSGVQSITQIWPCKVQTSGEQGIPAKKKVHILTSYQTVNTTSLRDHGRSN